MPSSSTTEPLSALLSVMSPISPPLAALTRARRNWCVHRAKKSWTVATGIEGSKLRPVQKCVAAAVFTLGSVSSKFQKDHQTASFGSPEFCDSIRERVWHHFWSSLFTEGTRSRSLFCTGRKFERVRFLFQRARRLRWAVEILCRASSGGATPGPCPGEGRPRGVLIGLFGLVTDSRADRGSGVELGTAVASLYLDGRCSSLPWP